MDENKVEKQELNANETSVVSVILAIIFPPLGVLLKEGVDTSLWINIILTLFGWFPGVIHALWVILLKDKN
jgi:uncharacterized membrane protein YqaE (UPF0057 family)